MKETEIKPCPFCGGSATICDHKFWSSAKKDFSYHSYGVKCRACGVENYQFWETEEEAITAWNRRADDEPTETLEDIQAREEKVGI